MSTFKNLKNSVYFLLAGSLLFLASCGTTAHVETVPGVDLDSYKTFNFIEKDASEKKNYKNFEETYLKNSIGDQLKKKGYREVKANADISIDYDVMVENSEYTKREPVYSQPFIGYRYNPYIRRVQTVYYPSRYVGDNSYQVPYKSGTVTVNLVDNKTNEVAWQGWAETELDRRKLSTGDIDETVNAIFKKFKK